VKIHFASCDFAAPVGDELPSLGGSGWYRCGLPAKALAALGHEIQLGTLAAGNIGGPHGRRRLGVRTWDGELHWDADVIVLQRWMHWNVASDIAAARAGGQLVINDIDDWFFGLDPSNRAFASSHPRLHPDANVNHYRKALAASSLITTSTPYLADRLGKMFPRTPIVVLRNMVEVDIFRQRHQPRSKPVIGWAGAIPWRSGDIETMQGILGPFLRESGCAFHHSGHRPWVDASTREELPTFAAAAKLDPSITVTTSPMVPTDQIPALYEFFDVGIVPLRKAPFNEAKSAIKGMEMAAAGIPVVAADLPEYRWAAKLGICTVADRAPRWLKELRALIPQDERVDRAAAQLAAVRSQAPSVRAHDWVDAYTDALDHLVKTA
jgi:glycosyltransferase involved in cell wall biosynthesis